MTEGLGELRGGSWGKDATGGWYTGGGDGRATGELCRIGCKEDELRGVWCKLEVVSESKVIVVYSSVSILSVTSKGVTGGQGGV